MKLQSAYCRCHHEERAYCPDMERTVMFNDFTDPDNENEYRAEMAADPDRQRMDYGHQFGAWDTPEETERKKARMNELFPAVTR